MNPAPIILFVYNRPDHTFKTLEALRKNTLADESILYVFSDGAKKESDQQAVSDVRSLIDSCTGFKEMAVVKQPQNKGLAVSVISGVSEVLKTHSSVIVLEDDIVTTPNFLTFMNDCLQQYASDQHIFSVTGYALPVPIPEQYELPVYLAYRGSSWGWGIWKDRWETIDWQIKDKEAFLKSPSLQNSFNRGGSDLSNMLIRQFKGIIDSWAIRFAYNAFRQNRYHITPVQSKVQNIGHDLSGVHSGKTTRYEVNLDQQTSHIPLPEHVPFNEEINERIFLLFKKPLYKKIALSFLRYIGAMK